MMSQQVMKKLHLRFVWFDLLGPESGLFEGFGWRQTMVISDANLEIHCLPEPEYFSSAAHGLEVQLIDQKRCLITRHTCDGGRSQFLAAVTLEEVADLLLQSGSHKIGLAAADVLSCLHERQLTTLVIDQGDVHH